MKNIARATDPSKFITVIQVVDSAVGCDVGTIVEVFPSPMISDVILWQSLSVNQNA